MFQYSKFFTGNRILKPRFHAFLSFHPQLPSLSLKVISFVDYNAYYSIKPSL